MNPTAMFIAGSALLAALGLLTWAWFVLTRVDAQLLGLGGFEDRHFEIGPRAAEDGEGAK